MIWFRIQSHCEKMLSFLNSIGNYRCKEKHSIQKSTVVREERGDFSFPNNNKIETEEGVDNLNPRRGDYLEIQSKSDQKERRSHLHGDRNAGFCTFSGVVASLRRPPVWRASFN